MIRVFILNLIDTESTKNIIGDTVTKTVQRNTQVTKVYFTYQVPYEKDRFWIVISIFFAGSYREAFARTNPKIPRAEVIEYHF